VAKKKGSSTKKPAGRGKPIRVFKLEIDSPYAGESVTSVSAGGTPTVPVSGTALNNEATPVAATAVYAKIYSKGMDAVPNLPPSDGSATSASTLLANGQYTFTGLTVTTGGALNLLVVWAQWATYTEVHVIPFFAS
jgi:hypothetical protein